MLSKQFVMVSSLALVLGVGAAQAQKVAILDVQGVLLATSDGKKAAAAIDAKFAPIKAELDGLQKDIVAKQDKLTKGRSVMAQANIDRDQREIDRLTTDFKRKNEDAQADLQEEENKQLGSVMPKLQQIVNAYAAANQIAVVVDSSANPNNLIYAEAGININTAILAAYEKAAASPSAPAAATTAPAPKAAAPAAAAPRTTPAPRPAPAK